MIEKITIKNKKGESIDLDFEELTELKSDLEQLEKVQTQPWPTYYPTIPNDKTYPFWQIPPVTCTGNDV